jgi:DNA invertase Pin-like site-specific DNA recombinase
MGEQGDTARVGKGEGLRVAIYARVSTDQQELAQQINACQRFCEYKQFEVGRLFTEIVSGAKARRPVYQEMVTALRHGEYEGVVAFRLDRLGRNARELALIIDELEGKGIKVLSVTEQFDTSTAMGKAMREFTMILAQLERDSLREATQHRLQALKNMGKKLGRPKGSKDKNPKGRKKAGYLLRYAAKKTAEKYEGLRGEA